MGLKREGTIVHPTIDLDDILLLDRPTATQLLRDFCADNRYTGQVVKDAFSLFARAAAQPGTEIEVPTRASTSHTEAVHNCMEAITTSSGATALAERAFDAAPGTHFKHHMRDDACSLVNTCTNA